MSTVRRSGTEPSPIALPAQVLCSLARGMGGEALDHLVRAQYAKANLLVRAIAGLAERLGEPRASEVRQAYHALLTVADQAPDAVRSVLLHPSVLSWAMATTGQLHAGQAAATPELLTLIGAAAAVRGGTDFHAAAGGAAADPYGLALPTLGYLIRPGAGDRVELHITGGIRLQLNGERTTLRGRAWRPLARLRIAARWSVQVDRVHSPLPEAEPLLAPGQTDRWRRKLAEGWHLLADDHPDVAADVATTVRTVLPLPAPRQGHSSGTYRHAFGCLSMSPPTDPRFTALTLAHEVQHIKLSGLMDLFPLVEESSGLGYAPWRGDPRPHIGLLQGAYAHLGVAAFWRRRTDVELDRARRHDARVEFVRWREAALEVCDGLLSDAPLTPLGRRFVTGMRDEMSTWRRDTMPQAVTAEAARLNDEHREQFRGTA